MNYPEPILFERLSAPERIRNGLEVFGDSAILTTSFGVQSAVLLHMVVSQIPSIPVIFIDTGFLFDETLEFARDLEQRLGLNLKIFRPEITSDELVERYGELWLQGEEGLSLYNEMVKIRPMEQALREYAPRLWFSGIRRSQSKSRATRMALEVGENHSKIYPVIDWSDRDVFLYLNKHGLPYHPLWYKGYLSVGDVHSSSRLAVGMDEEVSRFNGIKRECGLHEKSSGI